MRMQKFRRNNNPKQVTGWLAVLENPAKAMQLPIPNTKQNKTLPQNAATVRSITVNKHPAMVDACYQLKTSSRMRKKSSPTVCARIHRLQ